MLSILVNMIIKILLKVRKDVRSFYFSAVLPFFVQVKRPFLFNGYMALNQGLTVPPPLESK